MLNNIEKKKIVKCVKMFLYYEKNFFLKMMNCIDITNKGMSDTYFFSDEIQNEQKIQKAIRKILNYKTTKTKYHEQKKNKM